LTTLTDKEYDSMLAEIAHQTDMAAQADVACIRLKALCLRAADALEGRLVANDKDYWLVKELRKAVAE